jgi:sporadic carbohydrate cluster 2OG-Fe(II) oxygenase
MNFLSKDDKIFEKEFVEQGYVIRPVADKDALDRIHHEVQKLAISKLACKDDTETDLLDKIHKFINPSDLNSFRLEIIKEINEKSWLREAYYQLAKPYLDVLVGNELAMQLRVNLSIQMPEDDSSLLSVHADTWSGDSPYEVVVWLPLVNCFNTKSMYFLPPKAAQSLSEDFKIYAQGNSEKLFNAIKDDVNWMKVNYGEVVIFHQVFPHGNRVNEESETRWSMNCRFKSLFSPYKDKKIGEFFEPITMRPVTKVSMDYKLPTL